MAPYNTCNAYPGYCLTMSVIQVPLSLCPTVPAPNMCNTLIRSHMSSKNRTSGRRHTPLCLPLMGSRPSSCSQASVPPCCKLPSLTLPLHCECSAQVTAGHPRPGWARDTAVMAAVRCTLTLCKRTAHLCLPAHCPIFICCRKVAIESSFQRGTKVAICSQMSKRVTCNNIRRGDSMQMTTRSKMWLLGARCLVCRYRGGGSGQKILCLGIICHHTLDPGLHCALALLTNSDISLHKNTHRCHNPCLIY